MWGGGEGRQEGGRSRDIQDGEAKTLKEWGWGGVFETYRV